MTSPPATPTRSVLRLASFLLKLADSLSPGAELHATQAELARAAGLSLRSLPRALPSLSPAVEAVGRGRWRIIDRAALDALASASPPSKRRAPKSKTPPPAPLRPPSAGYPPNPLPTLFVDALDASERRVILTLDTIAKRLDTLADEVAELRGEVAKLRAETRRTRLNADFIDDGEPLADGAALLRAWVEANGLTLSQAAARLNLSRSAVSHYVNGHNTPPVATRKRIASVAGVPIASWNQTPNPDAPSPGSLPFEVG